MKQLGPKGSLVKQKKIGEGVSLSKFTPRKQTGIEKFPQDPQSRICLKLTGNKASFRRAGRLFSFSFLI